MAYSSFERSINARKQLRDRHGKWVYQGGSVKWFDGASWNSGKVTGFDGTNVKVDTGNGNTATVSRTDVEVIPKKATLGGNVAANKGQDWSQDDYNAKQKGTTLEVSKKDDDEEAAIVKGDGDDWQRVSTGELVNPSDYRVKAVINDPDDADEETENLKFADGADSGVSEDSEFGQFLDDKYPLDKYQDAIPTQALNDWFKTKFGEALDKNENPGWLDKSTGEYDLEPGDIVFGYMQNGPLQGLGKQKFVVGGAQNEEGQNVLYHLPKWQQKDHSPGIIFHNGKKNNPNYDFKITSAVRPPQTSTPKPKEEKRVTVLVKDLPAVYSPKTGDLVSDTEGEGYNGSTQKWHRILEDSPSKTSISGDPVYMVHKVGGPENYAPDTYGIKPQNIKAIQVTQERLDEIKNTPNSEEETNDIATPKSWFSPADDPGQSGDGWHASGPWGKYGAAGVMIQEQEEGKFLIIRRGAIEKATQGKWQLPGGAIEEKETPYQGAARETIEELKATQDYLDTLEHKGDVVFDNGQGWQYTNIAATAPTKFDPEVDILETDLAEWKTADELQEMKENGDLLPAFANHLDEILGKFNTDKESETKVDISEEQAEELITPEADENQESLDQIKENLGIPKTSVKDAKELEDLPEGSRINMYNTMFKENNYFVKTKDGKWWAEAFGPVPAEPKPLELQDNEDVLVDGFITEIVSTGPEAPQQPEERRRVSEGPTDLDSLPTGSTIQFSGADPDKTYTKNEDGTFSASWLGDDHKQKNVTSDQVHAIASYLGKDVEVVSEQADSSDIPEVKEMKEVEISEEDELTIAEMDKVDSLEESVAGTVATSSVTDQIYTKQPNGFWTDEDGTQFTPNDLVDSYGTDLELTPPREENNESSEPLKEGTLEELYNDAGVVPSQGDLDGLEEYLEVGDKLSLKGLLDTYPVTKQEDWSWTSDDTGAVIIYPGELDTQDPKNIVSITTRGTVYNKKDNSDITSAIPETQNPANPGDTVSTNNGINIDSNGNQWVPDKNDAPIYNGDIVKNKKGELGKVTFIQKGGKKVRVSTPDGDTKFWNAHMVEGTNDSFTPQEQKYSIQTNGDGKEYVTNANGDMIFVGDTVTSPGKAGFTGVVQGFKSNGQFVLVLDPADNKVKPRKTDKITVDESATSTAETPAVPAETPQVPETPAFNNGDPVKSGDFSKAPTGSQFHSEDSGALFEKIDNNQWKYYQPGKTTPNIANYNDADMENTLKYSKGDYVWGPLRAPEPESAQEEPQLAQWEKELLGAWDNGKPADAADVKDAPIGTVAHTVEGDGAYFKKDKEDNWQYINKVGDQELPTFNFTDSVLQEAITTLKNDKNPYIWGPPAKNEETTNKFSEGDPITKWQDLVDFKVGEYVNLLTGDHRAPYVKQEDGDFHNPVVGYSFSPAQFENAIYEGDIEYGGEEYIDDTELTVGEKIHGITQFKKLVPGDTVSVEGGIFDDPVTYEKMENGDFKNTNSGETVRPSAFNGAITTSAVTYTGKKAEETPSSSNHNFKTGDKIENLDDLDLLAPGEKVTHAGGETYTKKDDGTFNEDSTNYSGGISKVSFGSSVKAGMLQFGDTSNKSETPETTTLNPGDKVTTISQLEDMETGDVVTVSISDGLATKDYKKGSDGLFKSDTAGAIGHAPDSFKNTISEEEVIYKGKEETSTPSGPTPGSKINSVSEMDGLPAGSTFEVKFKWTPKNKTYVKLEDGTFETTDEDGEKYAYNSSAFSGTIENGNLTYTGQQEASAPAPEPTPTTEVLSLPGKNGKKVSVGAQVTKAKTAQKPAYSGEVVDINTASGDAIVKLPDGSKKKAKAKFLDVDQEAQAPTPETPETNEYKPAMYDVTPVVLPKDPDSPWYEKPMPQPPEAPASIQQPQWAVDGLFDEISQSYTDKGKGNFADDYYKNVYDQLAINGSLSIPANFQKNEEKYGPQKDIIDFFRARDHISEETAKKAREHFEKVKKEYEELQKSKEKDQAEYNEALKKHLEDLTSWKMANGLPLDSFNKESFTLSSADAINEILKKQGSSAEAGNKAFPSTKEADWNAKDIKSMRTWVSGGSYDDPQNPENSWEYVSWETWSKDMYQTKEAALVDPNNLSNKNHAAAYKAVQEAIAKSETKEDVVATRAGEIRNFTTLGGTQLQSLADLKNMEGSVLAFYSIFAGSPGSKGKDVGGTKNLDIQVRIPKGSHAAWLAGKNDIGMSSEMEVLLPPGSKFYVHKVIPGNGGWDNRPRVIVDLVPNDWTPEYEKSKISDIEGNIVVGPGGVVQTSTDVPGTETAGPTVSPTETPSIDFPPAA